jgi:dTDP-4-amino-4,6-dideoxygalactose transaminase
MGHQQNGSQPSIGFAALERQHAALRAELTAAFHRVVDSNAFILGAEVAAFEAEFAAFSGVDECVGVNSGTAALALALSAAGIGPGDEVIVPAHGFVATALAVMHAGALPVLCDVEADSGLIDPDAAAAVVSSRTAAIIPVHLYGQVCAMDEISALAARHGLFVLEDAAQAHGAEYRNRPAGSLGAAGAFSFYPSKNLGALGDGGAVCTSDPALARRVRELRDLGRGRGGVFAGGYNERLDGLQAALLRVKLPHLERWNEIRRTHAAAYREALEGDVRLLGESDEAPCIYHLFPIRVEDRGSVATQLRSQGIETGVHYSPPIHRQPALDELGVEALELPAAEAWAAEELSLPISAELRPAEREAVIAATLSAVRAVRGRAGALDV